MRCPTIMAIMLTGLLLAAAGPERHARADSVQNYSQEIPKSTGIPHKQRLPQPNWDARYKSGSLTLKEGDWLKGAFVPAESASKTAQGTTISVNQLPRTAEQPAPILTIAPDQIQAAYFDPKAEKDSGVMQRMPRSGCHYAESLMPKHHPALGSQAFVVWKASPGAFSRALERVNRRHPVRLAWTSNGTQNEIILLVNDCEYASFMATLRRFAGQRWQEVGHELKQ